MFLLTAPCPLGAARMAHQVRAPAVLAPQFSFPHPHQAALLGTPDHF